jgi:hypothetical protein
VSARPKPGRVFAQIDLSSFTGAAYSAARDRDARQLVPGGRPTTTNKQGLRAAATAGGLTQSRGDSNEQPED